MSEPLDIGEPKLGWWDKNIKGEKYIEFHKEPLVKVADGEGQKYTRLLEKMGESSYDDDRKRYLSEVIEQRRVLCEARLQAAKASKDKNIRDGALGWERELWFSDIASETLVGKHEDTRVLRGVVRSIVGEMVQLDRDLYLKRQVKMSSGPVGEVRFKQRLQSLVDFSDSFAPART